MVEDDGHPRQVLRRAAEGIGKVVLGIRGVKADGLLRAGEDDGLGTALNEIAQRSGGIGHGIRPVGDDKAVVKIIPLLNAPGHHQPVLGGNAGAVQIQKLDALHPADLPNGGNVGEQLLRGQLRCQAPRRHFRGNGPAGSNE